MEASFYKWFNEQEGYSLRSERFHTEVGTHSAHKAIAWLVAAYQQGFEDAINQVNLQKQRRELHPAEGTIEP